MFPELKPAPRAHFRSPAILSQMQRALYASGHERMQHRRHMESIAQDMQRPVEMVAPVYERILMQLKPHARVHDFLPIFVAKRVRRHFELGAPSRVLTQRSRFRGESA
jgi:hypothetical protein